MYDYDVIVIGAGVAGITAAKTCAKAGLDVCIIEKETIGGKSIHGGGTLFHHIFQSVKMIDKIHHHDLWKIKGDCSSLAVNFDILKSDYQQERHMLETMYSDDLKTHGITLIYGESVLTGEHKVQVDSQVYSGETIILAHGAILSVPDIKHIEEAMEHGFVIRPTDIASVEQSVESACILGGDHIAFEIADLFTRMEKNVILLTKKQPLHDIDHDARKVYMDHLNNDYLKIVSHYTDMAFVDRQVMYTVNGEDHVLTPDLVVLAEGYECNKLVMGDINIEVDESGIITNQFLQTSIDHIYAVGDANDKIKLSNVAIKEGEVAAKHILGKQTSIDYDRFMHGMMGVYEYAYIGQSEENIKAGNEPYHVHSFDLSRHNDLFSNIDTPLIKLCLSKLNHKVLGLHIVGEEANEELGHLYHIFQASSMPSEMALPIYTRMQKIKEEVDAVNHRHVDRLINEALVPVYQSIIDNKTHAIVGYELLSRFLIDGKLREPLPIIRMLESNRHIVSLDLKSIENAGNTFKKLAKKSDEANNLMISINISSVTLNTETIDAFIGSLDKYHMSPDNLVIEVTERQMIDNEKSLAKLRELKNHGFLVALDDFSMGHASLPLINRFTFDVVKLDQSLLPVDKQDLNSEHAYRYLVNLLKKQSIKIIAEGIETEFQAKFLSELPVDYLQGFFYSKPSGIK